MSRECIVHHPSSPMTAAPRQPRGTRRLGLISNAMQLSSFLLVLLSFGDVGRLPSLASAQSDVSYCTTVNSQTLINEVRIYSCLVPGYGGHMHP